MTDIIEREGDRIYINRTPPCGHSNGTHPSGCWWPATSEMIGQAIVAERARIIREIKASDWRTSTIIAIVEGKP